mmetsp:Transcript_21875/g.33921  ORF Transcript_21875/g.33921 Transcript_21875/m.33921 type:complete len:225 (-) Transcript_21875:1262-1936(-)
MFGLKLADARFGQRTWGSLRFGGLEHAHVLLLLVTISHVELLTNHNFIREPECESAVVPLIVGLLPENKISIVLDDDLPSFLIAKGLHHVVIVLLRGFTVLQEVMDILVDVRELVNDLLERFCIVAESRHVSLRHVTFYHHCFVHDTVMVDHLACLEVPLGGLIVDDTIHYEVDVLRTIARLGDEVTLREPFRDELFEVLRVEVIVSVLKELVDHDRIGIDELG